MKQKKQDNKTKPRVRREFTPEFKRDAVRLVKSGRSLASVSRELNIGENGLREWVKRADADAGERQDVLIRCSRVLAQSDLQSNECGFR